MTFQQHDFSLMYYQALQLRCKGIFTGLHIQSIPE